MANDRAVGGTIFVASIFGIVVYGLLIYFWPLLILEITAFLGVLLLLSILAWIGYTMATTPPPEPISDVPIMGPDKPPATPATEKKEAAPT